ncbi:MAG: cytochrome c3 family protein [Thermodesulfobacteriota bacterium]
MDDKKERLLAFGLLVVLLVVGIAAYGSFPIRAPEVPTRMYLVNNGGNLLFSHEAHVKDYGAESCDTCHHTGDMNPAEAVSCANCHDESYDEMPKDDFDHKAHYSEDGYGQSCTDCHTESFPEGKGPKDCTSCHKPGEDRWAPNKMAAFHDQCIKCHEDQGAGPVKCAECHRKY